MTTRVRDVIKLLEKDGWFFVNMVGSHHQYEHPTKKGKVTVAGKLSDDVRQGTLASILRQAGLK
ncbi:MAG: addiction module toxin, HicA family [Microcystis aeruginosa Ma_AC_P_19900807_S299]|jgi:predicted RNA binding protein YcfA (HicA-like mRNA interferase family)|uniref:Addiction module toxin, HicA family n=1 Tax=Microcystis aeruginosa Ma_SC_T_19800800_S464 TaxID=2486257 RepID=A0A552E6P5_MICAE|nr:MAG: addiction module toxin, HicA family [Microcystis aeruginosa Ma_AC_P_19900807_S299]TRU30160.1 MAG: addiction module toxin, HicA family [Microcystis aeruginosa Ma_SC_T_19800800_S464]